MLFCFVIVELEEAPADLNRRVLFKKPAKKLGDTEKKEVSSNKRSLEKQNGPKRKHNKLVLSFDEEDEDNCKSFPLLFIIYFYFF